ncbi:MAG: glutamyl-tRNA reductase [Bacteroidota bacterium]
MLGKYKIITITHKRINLKDIAQFVVQADDKDLLKGRLSQLKSHFDIDELMYVATCNRVMYFFTAEQTVDDNFTRSFFKYINPNLSEKWLDQLPEVSFSFEGINALRHLFDVSASIDSLVIGERQILGQLRESYDHCSNAGLCGDDIRLAMNQAIISAKSVYSKTQIGDKAISVVSLATRKLLNTGISKSSRILVVGAGQTNQLVAKFLSKHNFTNVTVFNRTVEKAATLAETFSNGSAFPLNALPYHKEGFDCMVVCTASKEPIITPDLYRHLLQGDDSHKIIIDLSIPHNVDEKVIKSFPINYIEIDGLRSLARDNMAAREREVIKAKALLEDYLEEFPVLYKQRQVELAMRAVPVQIKAVKSKAINEVFRKEMDALDGPTQELIKRMMTYMEKKCIGIPMKAARETFAG